MVVIAAFQSITMEVWASSSHTRYSRIVQLYIDILYLSIAFPTLSILSYKTFWVSRNWPWQGNGKLFTDTAERFVGKGKGTVEQSCGDSEFDSQQEFCWVQGGSWRFFILGFETESSTRSSEAAPWWKVRVRFGTAASCQDNSGWSWDGRRCSERRRTILQCRRCNSCLPVMSCVSVCVSQVMYIHVYFFTCQLSMSIQSHATWISWPTKCKLAVYFMDPFSWAKCSGNTTFSTSITRRCTNLRPYSLLIAGMLQLHELLPWFPQMHVQRTWIELFAWFCLS